MIEWLETIRICHRFDAYDCYTEQRPNTDDLDQKFAELVCPCFSQRFSMVHRASFKIVCDTSNKFSFLKQFVNKVINNRILGGENPVY